MKVIFDPQNIENRDIYTVLEQLAPALKLELDPGYNYRVLDHEKASEKQELLYEQIAIPFLAERRKYFSYHHDMVMPGSWQGEQACLSMIYAINQKARWLLYYFAVRETTEKYIRLPDDQLDVISKQITGELIDDNEDIKKAVSDAFSHIPDMNSDTENLIIKGIAGLIQKYEEAPSHPMIYR